MTARFSEEATTLAGLWHVTRNPLGDARGYLERVFCVDELVSWSHRPIAQVNRTFTATKGTLRGLHFQHPPSAECKYVTCLKGAVFDVAVDLRKASPTFGQWFGVEISAQAHNALLIPEGFAHGFQTLTDDVEMLYLHSASYASSSEGGVNALDPALAVAWPIKVYNRSPRDQDLPFLADIEGIDV
ncbi:dTDP-4-dehydrorhamnose 3,5-epimerase family protein (plasmid) [Peteryoungia desertarenae]|uniref:dTDP-4-dehydrorhamnose 3,5-epimerase n=1 Tax=Peteryoungia desertarenae TaxID=1813451 RepID=A0ABX6QTN5_9HYPH|nr:dTDP-4-dehydrorhamnose 3,5-epimerase family protein [Peteryoungia desertarenae]QLF71757.1 dTDP-4-dehydrorhamnose 3,5-epimerase family protein [Peteryoungia desertarenae]